MKHNKKRNTAFLYEVLLREGTKASLEKNFNRLNIIKDVLINAFHPESPLGRELSLYNAIRKPESDISLDDRYLNEVKNRYLMIDKREIFNEQTRLINYVNKYLGHSVYNNFVPYYKDLASISQIFNSNTSIKEKLLLEKEILNKFKLLNENKSNSLKPIDAIVYKTFVKKFNDKYSNLLNEQKDLLTKYVSSFGDDGLELKLYLNEEIERLKSKINNSLKLEEIQKDSNLHDKTSKLLEVLNDFKENKELSSTMLENILKIQQFVNEVEN